MLFKNWMCSSLLVVSQVIAVSYARADIPYAPGISGGVSGSVGLTGQLSYGLAGSGYWGGTQACPYRTKTSKAAVNESDDIKREKAAIEEVKEKVALKKLERDRGEKKLEILAKKLEKFFETEVAEFLISTHMDKMNKCEDYRTFPDNKCASLPKSNVTTGNAKGSGDELAPEQKAIQTTCNGKDTVPDLLKDTWIKADGSGGYCGANSNAARGATNSAICADKTLQPADTPKFRKLSSTECARALSDYRKARMEYDKVQEFVDRKQEEIEDRTAAVADKQEMAKLEREYKMKTQLEGKSRCVDCDQGGYERPQRDWWSTAANVVGGLGLAWYGKKIDESAQEYNAQLGFPSTNSYGYPFVTAGVYSIINGLAGPGAYGCAGGVSGSGFPYGGGGALGPYGANGYGPFGAQGGAFGYPQGMYGSPWGGGMYNPGFGLNGSLNGPNGGWPFGFNGQAGLGIPVNGQIGIPAAGGWQSGGWQQNQIMCIQWPCNVGANGALAGAINGQIGIPASGGWQQSLPGLGNWQNGGMLNTNYQLQMLQQQQAMMQQQAQQQAMLAQYYQAQAQQQMQAYQRQQAIQQQAAQVQQEIVSLQMRLQMLMSGAYSGSSIYAGGVGGGSIYGGGSLGTGLNLGIGGVGSIYFGAATSTGYAPTYPIGTAATLPGLGTATTTRGR